MVYIGNKIVQKVKHPIWLNLCVWVYCSLCIVHTCLLFTDYTYIPVGYCMYIVYVLSTHWLCWMSVFQMWLTWRVAVSVTPVCTCRRAHAACSLHACRACMSSTTGDWGPSSTLSSCRPLPPNSPLPYACCKTCAHITWRSHATFAHNMRWFARWLLQWWPRQPSSVTPVS